MRFAQPSRSWALLLGTTSYTDPGLPSLPAVANNLADLRNVLTDPGLGGLDPERCIVRADPPRLEALGMELARVARQAEDTLIVYYAGHGVLDDSGALFLALPETHPGHAVYTAVPLTWVRRAIADSPARSRILILDCCFSGRAIEAMASPSSLISGQIEIAGAYTLASAPENEPARAPVGARHTAFTGELLSLLRTGIDNSSEGLSLEDIYLELKRAHLARGLPAPQQRSTATIGHLALVRNASCRLSAPAGPPTPAPAVPQPAQAAAPASVPRAQAARPVVAPGTVAEPPWAAGLAAWRAGRLDDADRLIRNAAESASDSRTIAAVSIVLGLLHLHGYQHPGSAETLLARAADSDDVRLAALGRLHHGYALELKKEMAAAENAYRRVMSSPEADCAALAAGRLGMLLADRGLGTEAEHVFRAGHALADSSTSVWPTLGLADTLMCSGRSGEAASMYEEALASGDPRAMAYAAVGLRRFFMEGGLMAEAAEMARFVVESPAASFLWPAVLCDEAPVTPDGRVYAMLKWLTWLRSAGGESACFADRANRGQFILFENQDSFTMSVCVMPSALPRRLRRGYREDISFQLADIGLIAQEQGSLSAKAIASWVMNVTGKSARELAELSENILAESLIGKSDFILDVEAKPDPITRPQPRSPAPDLLPW